MSLPSSFRKVNWQPMMSKYPTQSLMPIPAAMGQLRQLVDCHGAKRKLAVFGKDRRIYSVAKLKQRIIRIISIYIYNCNNIYIFIHVV